MMLLTLTCMIATLANPYHYKVYLPVFDFAGQRGFYDLISELQSPQFRTLAEWLALGLAVGAAYVLGKRRKIDVFFGLVLLMAITISFRSKRDIWLVVVAAAGVMTASYSELAIITRFVLRKAHIVGLATGIAVVVVSTMRATDMSEQSLKRKAAEALPVEAAAVVESRGYGGPLYNHFDWGGYLIWRLPALPVAMDGRTNIYGVEKMTQSLKVWTGQAGWNSDAELACAGVVIAQIDQPLTSLLRLDPRFDLVYEDKIAAVFVARNQGRVYGQ
jgi:hypothetical protein